MNPRTARLVYFLFALSGFAGLIYESLWSRYLKLLLGHSSYGQILTLVIYMGGLGIGSFIGGRWASKLRQPMLLYAGAEGAIGLGALLYHGLFVLVQQGLYQALATMKLTGLGATALKTLAATLLTMPWAIALGITFPALAIGLIQLSGDQGKQTLPGLYFSNSLGAAIGVLSASYWLVPNFGTPGTLILAGLINLGLGGVFYLLGRTETQAPAPSQAAEPAPNFALGRLTGLLLGVSMLTGLSSFLYEISWIRLLSLIIDSSTHSFDLMVAAFILGLAFGGLFARRLHKHLRQPLVVLAAVHLLMGLAAALSLILYQSLFDLVNQAHLVLMSTVEAYPFFTMFKYSLCLLLMFPASFLAGTTLPLITWTLVSSQGETSQVGKVYGWNTLGAILGAALGGLLLMPWLQLKGTLLSGALIDVGLGLGLYALVKPSLPKLGLAIAVSAGLLVPPFLLKLNPFTLASGRFRFYQKPGAPAADDSIQIKDGRTATISFQRQGNRYVIATNGKPDASLNFSPQSGQSNDELTQLALGMYPINLMQKPYRAAMIGFGSGMSAQILLGDPFLQQLDIIEIEPVMTELARGFLPFNRRAYESPKARLIYDDAKAYFFARQQQYDVIVSEPSNPWVSGVSSLFSAEFYSDMRRFIKPEGVLVQWMHSYEFNDELLLSILKALQGSFAQVAVYGVPDVRPGHTNSVDMVILAGQQPIKFPPVLRNLPQIAPELKRMNSSQAAFSPALRIFTSKTLDPLLQKLNPNSDYFPIVDNQAEVSMYSKQFVKMFRFLGDSPLYYQSLFEPDFAEVLQQRQQLKIDAGELTQQLTQFEKLLSVPLEISVPSEINASFAILTQNFFQQLDFQQKVFHQYESYLEAAADSSALKQFRLLRALNQNDSQAAMALIDEIVATEKAPQLQLPVIRAMAIYCLQHRQAERLDRVVKRLALSHPHITETEKLYLLSVAAITQ